MVEERGGVIGLLQREVEDLKAALASAETHPSAPVVDSGTPVVDPRLEQELEKVIIWLGNAAGAATGQVLQASSASPPPIPAVLKEGSQGYQALPS